MEQPELISLGLLKLVVLFPLFGFIINGLLGRYIGRRGVSLVGVLTVAVSFILALISFFSLLKLSPAERLMVDHFYTWIQSGSGEWDLTARVAFQLDPLSAVMILVVSGVGLLIHIYSTGYMHGDPRYAKYFAFLNLFTFNMLLLVLADNILLMFVGWEGVGLCSYLLIGFWFDRESAANAGMKAFIVNRIGDFGFILGIMLIFVVFRTLDFKEMAEMIRSHPEVIFAGTATAITMLLFIGAVGKSAQIPLYVWLPDAMEGPTPVSALIHAATMVTAGVYMIARLNFLFILSPTTMSVVAVVGCATAIYAASIGLVQNDIKRVLAYSTISQLGYMFLAMGVGAFAAGIFHLMTHAFFKALLFLGAGSVMHAMSNETDIRKMGGLRAAMPWTFWTFLIAALAISGIPGFSGFFSKDEILWSSYSSPYGNILLWLVAALAAGMTAFYMFRLTFRTFFGQCRAEEEVVSHIHESPRSMTLPLAILGIFSIIGGYVGVPKVLGGANRMERFLAPVFGGQGEEAARATSTAVSAAMNGSHSAEVTLMVASVVIALTGVLMAYVIYILRPRSSESLAAALRGPYRLLLNKYYVDEIYNLLIVKVIVGSSRYLWHAFDDGFIDRVVNGVAAAVRLWAAGFRRMQSGYLQNYLFFMVAGILVVALILLL